MNEPAFAVTDSAGVKVVTTRVPAWPDGGESPWALSVLTEIGEPDGTEPYLFGESVYVALLPDARIAVADRQSADIRIFGADGEFHTRWGQRGMGVGEFERLSWLASCGNELTTYDSRLRRLTTFSLDGEVVRVARFDLPERKLPSRLSCLPDGSILAVGLGDHTVDRDPGVYFYSVQLPVWRMFPGTGRADPIGTYLAGEWVSRTRESGGGRARRHPFGRATVFAGDAQRIAIGSGERLEFEIRSLDGALSGIVRGPDPDLAIDDAILDSYRTTHLAGDDSAARATLAEGGLPMPPSYPAYSRIIVDQEGYVWVERFVLPWSIERRWGVFAPDGVFLGHVTFPSEFQMMGVDTDRLIGVVEDEVGGIRVRLYELDRAPAGRADPER